jgi:hypothetical protein
MESPIRQHANQRGRRDTGNESGPVLSTAEARQSGLNSAPGCCHHATDRDGMGTRPTPNTPPPQTGSHKGPVCLPWRSYER